MQTSSSTTELHVCAFAYLFTGKERDTESGLDYFGARYYASGMGRFMSPDWSAKEEPVPYAKLDNPQSLNLFAFVQDNPVTGFDRDGHNVAYACGILCMEFHNTARTLLQGEAGSPPAQQNSGPTLPQNPSGLGSDWKDVTPKGGTNPKIPKRFRGPKGTEIEFDPGVEGKPGWGGKDHWHEVGPDGKREDGHLAPGTQIPGPDGVPDAPKPANNPAPTEQRSRSPLSPLMPFIFNPSWIPHWEMPRLVPLPCGCTP